MEEKAPFRSGFVALIGRPNSGKSTLLNTVLGEQLSIVTPLPQTTRRNLRGIVTTEHLQIIFIDTPGIHRGKYAFNEAMILEARLALAESGVDLVCYLVDLTREFGEEESVVASIVRDAKLPVLLVFNKIDACKDPAARVGEFLERHPAFRETASIRIAAKGQEYRQPFLDAVAPFIPEGPRYYDSDDLTDASMRFFAAEFIRKQIIGVTRDEVPHAAFVEIEDYRETPGKHIIVATIHVETVGQRGIIVGAHGTMIERIRKGAEREMAKLTGVRVQMKCHVKISPDWRDNERFLRSMGMPVRP